ncbi:aldo/keto reductase [Ignicoccus hospitalis KIN4/I]|uniref:Aldo/keto reductase n=1 Tax=Ignicoccus hospitalis (strain KIN4/I / DSM 18386 / JCM 14125) TaxID=453591 RepID=A8A9M9_IGNH4|nr:aldo/keto reductase [Ignicoccus hospitalis KIN4/I]
MREAAELRRIGGEAVSDIGLGSWAVRDPKSFVETLVKAFEMGINLVDTAEMYRTEPLVREAMEIYGSKEIFVTTKLYPWNVRHDCERALRRQVERLGKVPDLTLVHWPEDIATEVRELEKMVDKGLTRMIGVSNVTKEQLEVALHATKKHEIVAVQNKYSPTFTATEELFPTLEEKGIALQAHTPLDRGRALELDWVRRKAEELGAPPAAIVIAWLLSRSPVVIPIPKTERVEHLMELLEGTKIKL